MKRLIYVEIAEQIMIELLNSNLPPGSKIGSVREMSLRFEVNPKTIQKAYDYLDDKGIFTTVVGGGRYLSKGPDVLSRIKSELINQEIEQFTNKMKLYECSLQLVTSKIAEQYEQEENNEQY